ncbi:MAG TPA: M20/M25/M40 family metallo-hydrolase, partial [Thermoanaerobaculia bacterium]|nr:M20/M25/M40 family metallo-hydrolase [Thermoanaerobaculia bacterium]
LWLQSFEGQTVVIGGARGWKPGAVVLPSVHLREAGLDREGPFSEQNLYIDIGAESAAEVAEMGIRRLDPVALIRRPSRLAGGLVAAPAAASKAACVALAEAARRYRPTPGTGTVVFAWTAANGLNGASLQHLIRRHSPFQEAILLGDGPGGFGWEDVDRGSPLPRWLPAPGSGLIGAGTLPAGLQVPTAPHSDAGGIGADIPRVGYLGIPARYPGTPVETIAFRDVKALADALLASLGGNPTPPSPGPDLPAPPALAEENKGHQVAARLLGSLIARYGVSGAEGPVREEVLRNLPKWAKPETDAKGNVTVTVGSGGEPLLFVAHMDEVGFRVEEVLPDGRLRLQTRGGLLPSVWEAQAALVHGGPGSDPVPGVFEPREDWRTSKKAVPPLPLTVYLGVGSAQEAASLGIQAGSTVTMPKRMLRIGRHRVLARSFDDRVGSTALLLALRQLDPAKLKRRVTFAWSVEEEVGLNGSRALAERMHDFAEVHPVDTFVSSDSPIESPRYAHALLGQGPVLRAMDNGFLAPRPLIDRFLALGERRGIPLQVGFTGGATDGMPFLADTPVMLPFSWPGRYSHSPIEVADLRDLE